MINGRVVQTEYDNNGDKITPTAATPTLLTVRNGYYQNDSSSADDYQKSVLNGSIICRLTIISKSFRKLITPYRGDLLLLIKPPLEDDGTRLPTEIYLIKRVIFSESRRSNIKVVEFFI